jgi:hypothetical protein
MDVIVLYRIAHTFTNAVYEHLLALKTLERSNVVFAAIDSLSVLSFDLEEFDALIVHYSLRLPFDQISERAAEKLRTFKGVKALLIQDDYDDPRRACYWMNRCQFDVVFTVVPDASLAKVYSPELVPGMEFVSVLTGYAEDLRCAGSERPPSVRPITIGYRGRTLPLQYGQLGREKVTIGKTVKRYCDDNGISSDIAWTDDKRIYGAHWYEFIADCRATLCSESGCNVFDWDNDLVRRLAAFRAANPAASEAETYNAVGLMNQISPRCFEAIALRSVLVMFEGRYSDVLREGVHYLSLKKDFSNIGSVFDQLADDSLCNAMAERAHADIIGSGVYSYKAFVEKVGQRLVAHGVRKAAASRREPITTVRRAQTKRWPKGVTELPNRITRPDKELTTLREALLGANGARDLGRRVAYYSWGKVPAGLREEIKPRLRRLLRFD